MSEEEVARYEADETLELTDEDVEEKIEEHELRVDESIDRERREIVTAHEVSATDTTRYILSHIKENQKKQVATRVAPVKPPSHVLPEELENGPDAPHGPPPKPPAGKPVAAPDLTKVTAGIIAKLPESRHATPLAQAVADEEEEETYDEPPTPGGDEGIEDLFRVENGEDVGDGGDEEFDELQYLTDVAADEDEEGEEVKDEVIRVADAVKPTLTPAQRRRLALVKEKYKTIKMGDEGTIGEILARTTLSTIEVSDAGKPIRDKSLNFASLKDFDDSYTKNVLEHDTMQVIKSLSDDKELNMHIVKGEKTDASTQFDSVYLYKFELEDDKGKKHHLRF
jgi:hypothetical protein